MGLIDTKGVKEETKEEGATPVPTRTRKKGHVELRNPVIQPPSALQVSIHSFVFWGFSWGNIDLYAVYRDPLVHIFTFSNSIFCV